MRSYLALVLLLAHAPAFAKYTICTATINSKDEREVFKRRLDPKEFDFVELTDFKGDSNASQDGWFTRACQAGVKCDVLVVSGHFGGSFFGQTKLSLGLKELEQNSCDNKCDGILGHLKETYLMGCNTLASKFKDARTPDEYLAVLVRDGVPRADAERVVAARYGPFGSSFGDRMSRVFEGTPIIYGFSSVGPSGANVRKSLDQFLDRLGDYKTHLDKLDAGAARTAWYDVMKPYNRTTAVGLLKSNRAYEIKTNSCALSNTTAPIEGRIEVAERLLDENLLLYLPTVSGFFTDAVRPLNYEAGGLLLDEGRRSLERLRGRGDLAKQFASARDSDGTTPSLKVDILKTERNIGWLSAWDYGVKMRKLLSTFTANPDTEGGDFMCSQMSEDSDIKRFVPVGDINSWAFDKPAQFKMAQCLRLQDESFTRRALDGFDRNRAKLTKGDPRAALSILSAFVEMPGEFARRADLLRPYMKYRGPNAKEVRLFILGGLVATTTGSELTQHTREMLATPEASLSSVAMALGSNANRTDEAVGLVIAKLMSLPSDRLTSVPYGFLRSSPALLSTVADILNHTDVEHMRELVMNLTDLGNYASPKLDDALIDWLSRLAVQETRVEGQKDVFRTTDGVHTIVAVLTDQNLNAHQLHRIQDVYRKTSRGNVEIVRDLLYRRGRGVIDLDESILTQPKLRYDCSLSQQGMSCGTRTYIR